MLAGELPILKIGAGTRGFFGEADKIAARAGLRRHAPALGEFDDTSALSQFTTAFLACVHDTSLPLSTETRWKGYI